VLPPDPLAWVHPVLATAGTVSSEVTGTDGLNYVCILGHTSIASNRPITGPDWHLYWDQQDAGGAAWLTATAYVNQACLIYTYKKALADFTAATDNPDMPPAWTRYLIHRLAHDIGCERGVALDERIYLQKIADVAREVLFPSLRPQATDYHNKTAFFDEGVLQQAANRAVAEALQARSRGGRRDG
jgi:hypothetical protein